MIDPFDYKEPRCSLCGGKEFYNPDKDAPSGRIPVMRIIEKLDGLFAANDMDEAGRLLVFWQAEAVSLRDREGELSIVDETVGFYRKTREQEKALAAVSRALELISLLYDGENVSTATIKLNCATTLKAFGETETALPLYDEAYKTYSSHLDKNDQRLGAFFNNYALALTDLKRFDEAEEAYKKAIKITALSDKKIDLAVSYVNLAHLYEAWGKDKKYIDDCLFSAYGVFNDESIEKDGYYAYVAEKCAPSFRDFGYVIIADELDKVSKELYRAAKK